ncbi:MAG: Ig-like domain-containing protein, partial [Proteobacteria bacterium]|nr:Ig-like domain-containing protein [Pseudomonadota bacterium]
MGGKLSNLSLEYFVLLSFMAFAFSCSSPGSKEESTVASADTTVPTVTTISPADGTTNKAVTSTISITFNKSIEPRNVTASTSENCSGTMQLSVDGFNSCIPAVVSYDSSRKIYTLTAGSSSSTLELVSSTKH